MSKIFDALRKAEQEPNPLVRREDSPVSAPSQLGRQARIFEREFGSLSNAIQAYFPKAASGKILLVVGCADREGASYVSVNLARTLATASGAPTLYMDTNFHQPALPRVFPVGDGAGLSDVYENGRPRDLTSLIRPADRRNLYVLGVGNHRQSPVAFFDSAEFDAILNSLRRAFRFTIADGAPLLKYPDAIQLAARTDGVVLVVRQGHLKREVIRKGIELLQGNQVPILGAVLNRRKFAIPTLVYKLFS
jgi:Mrp family chromosome partitioning ATPase